MPSTKSRCEAAVLALGLLALMTGCAGSTQPPARFADGVTWVARQHHVSDASTQRIGEWPCLRVDSALEGILEAAILEPDLESARRLALLFVSEAHALSLRSTDGELKRLDDDGWRELIAIYFNDVHVAPTDEVRQSIAEAFKNQTDLQAWFLKREVESAADTAGLRRTLGAVRKRIEPSVKQADRSGQKAALAIFAIPAALARGAIHAEEASCQMDEDFEGVIRFEPEPVTQPEGEAPGQHDALLAAYAPVVIQEHPKDVAYPRSADAIGRVTVADDASIDVDVARPAVYGYARTVLLGKTPHVQLTYAIWYPQRPALKSPIDAEAGKIDGATLRITLDSQMRPAIFETLNNCGCHHRLYPTEDLEAAAMAQHGSPLPGKSLALERDINGKYDLIVPKVLRTHGALRPILRCRAGTHAIVDVDFVETHANETVVDHRRYQLVSYDELETLRTPAGRYVSMFLDNGLVRGAERMEGDLFAPLGMLNAGQPRQRGTQLIQWDDYDFDHPRLLESTLRLPASF